MLLAELNLIRQKRDLLTFNLQSLLNIENYKATLIQINFCNEKKFVRLINISLTD